MAIVSNLFRLRDANFSELEKAGIAFAAANIAFSAADGDGLTEEERNAQAQKIDQRDVCE